MGRFVVGQAREGHSQRQFLTRLDHGAPEGGLGKRVGALVASHHVQHEFRRPRVFHLKPEHTDVVHVPVIAVGGFQNKTERSPGPHGLQVSDRRNAHPFTWAYAVRDAVGPERFERFEEGF